MLTVEQLNRVTMAAMYDEPPKAYGLPNTDEVRDAIDETRAWLDANPGVAIDMVNEWPEASDELMNALYRDPPEVKAAGGVDRNRGGAEELREYWVRGEGAAKIQWGTPGDFKRCVALLEEHMPGRAEGYCANRHHDAVGSWPGDHKELNYTPVETKREFTTAQRERRAESGSALPDGSFPISNREDLANAIQAYGRAKDKEKARRHIIARARALNAVSMLPDSWDVEKSTPCKGCGETKAKDEFQAAGSKPKFDEEAHPRHGSGGPTGGRFKEKDAGEEGGQDNKELDQRGTRPHPGTGGPDDGWWHPQGHDPRAAASPPQNDGRDRVGDRPATPTGISQAVARLGRRRPGTDAVLHRRHDRGRPLPGSAGTVKAAVREMRDGLKDDDEKKDEE